MTSPFFWEQMTRPALVKEIDLTLNMRSDIETDGVQRQYARLGFSDGKDSAFLGPQWIECHFTSELMVSKRTEGLKLTKIVSFRACRGEAT